MFKFLKKYFSVIIAVLMLTMTSIVVNAEELIIGIDNLSEVVGIIEHEHEELMPRSTCVCPSGHSYNTKTHFVKGTCLTCHKEGPGSYSYCIYCNDEYVYMSICGHYCRG